LKKACLLGAWNKGFMGWAGTGFSFVELPPRDQAAAFFIFPERFFFLLRITFQRPD
jgi:hypothetical protein